MGGKKNFAAPRRSEMVQAENKKAGFTPAFFLKVVGLLPQYLDAAGPPQPKR
jgi:hypothetical protein